MTDKHIMVDLETWGTRAGSDIRSIGAAVFDPIKGVVTDKFYINLEGGDDFGLTADPATVEWWSQQSDEAVRALKDSQVFFKEGLERFRDWWLKVQGGKATRDNYTRFWANGSHFDYVLLVAAYEAAGVDMPWIYRAPRGCKTVWDAAGGVDIPFEGVVHNALDDAVHQANCVIKAYNKLGIS